MTPEEIETLPYRPCVGIMILNKDNQVFVGQRTDRYKDAWQMPQGGVEKGEDPQEAALREMTEETGIPADLVEVLAQTDAWLPYDLPHDIVPKIWNGKYRGQKQKWFLLRFSGEDAHVNIETEHQEFAHWRWLDVEELVSNIVPFKRDVYVEVLNAFRAHL